MSGSVCKGSGKSTARSKRDRLHQIHRWLQYEFGRKTRLRIEVLPKEERAHLGYVEIGSGIPLIRIRKGSSLSESISILLHEYAHVISHYEHGPHWKRKHDGHDRNFYLTIYKVETRYFYEEGHLHSREF